MITGRKAKFTVPRSLDPEKIHEGTIVDVSLRIITIEEEDGVKCYSLTDPKFISIED